jgi:hypothetical protein
LDRGGLRNAFAAFARRDEIAGAVREERAGAKREKVLPILDLHTARPRLDQEFQVPDSKSEFLWLVCSGIWNLPFQEMSAWFSDHRAKNLIASR